MQDSFIKGLLVFAPGFIVLNTFQAGRFKGCPGPGILTRTQLLFLLLTRSSNTYHRQNDEVSWK